MIESLADVMVMKGVPEHIRSDNGPEFVAKDLRKWLLIPAQRHSISNPAVRGRTATPRASTQSCGTPAPETWQPEVKTGYGEVESFPHTLDGDEMPTEINALH